jgi:hypothetical protein
VIATELELGDEEIPWPRLWTANLVVRRSALDLVGPFEPAIPAGAGDEEQWLVRLERAGGVLMYLPDAWLWHRRTAQDLVFSRMLRAKFRRGYNQVPFFRWADKPLSRSRDIRTALAWVGHAARRRCAGGLLEAAQCLGRFRGIRHNHAVIPPQPEEDWSRPA